MENYTGDLSVEEELAPVEMTAERWARQYRVKEFPKEIPDALNGWWYKTCSGFLPNDVDAALNFGNTRTFLFAGPEGTGRYTTAMMLASNLYDREYSCYCLTGEDFDIWEGDRMEAAVQQIAVGQVQDAETGEDLIEGRTVVIRYPEECKRFRKLQKALYSVLMYCREMDLPLFLIVITNDPAAINSRLRREMTPCVFRLPDEEERRRFIRSFYEGSGFRFDQNGNIAVEKERREHLVSDTEGFSYDQLKRILYLAMYAVKEKILQQCAYLTDEAMNVIGEMEYLFLEPEELDQIVDRIRDEEKIAAKAAAPVVLSGVPYAGAFPAGGAVPVQNAQMSAGMNTGTPKDEKKKKQLSLAEMYKAITSEME